VEAAKPVRANVIAVLVNGLAADAGTVGVAVVQPVSAALVP
jgi:hypothetical protein